MDDLMAKLQQILNSSEGQENLKQVAGMLGEQNGQLDLGAISSILGQGGGQAEPPKESAPPNTPVPNLSGLDLGGLGLGGLDVGSLLKVQGIFQSMNQDNKNTALIRALRPHLREERQHRVDEALRLMQLISVLPALRESGLLGKLFGGD